MLFDFFFSGIKKYGDGGSLTKDYSPEKKMLIADVMKLKEYATKLSDTIHDKDDVEAWVISKIAKVEQTTANVKHALEAEYPDKFEQGGNVGEHEDGEIAKMMLLHIGKYATKMLDAIEEKNIELQAWMTHELAIAGEMIDSVFHYMDFFVNHAKLQDGGYVGNKFFKTWTYNGKKISEITYSGDTKYSDIKRDFPSLTDKDLDILDAKGEVEVDGYEIRGERGYAGINFVAHKEEAADKMETGGAVEPTKAYKIIFEDISSYAEETKVDNLTDAQYENTKKIIAAGIVALDRVQNGIHSQFKIKSIQPMFEDGGGIGEYLDKFRARLEDMSDEALAKELANEWGIDENELFIDITTGNERESYINEMVDKQKQVLKSRGEFAKGGKLGNLGKLDKLGKGYTHFALLKADNKIVDGWDYSSLYDKSEKKYDTPSITEYTKIDLEDRFPHKEYSDFKILSRQTLKRRSIDPSDTNNWYKHPVLKDGGSLEGDWVVYDNETMEIIGDRHRSYKAAKKAAIALLDSEKYKEVGCMPYKRWSDENIFARGGSIPFSKKLKVGKVMHEFKHGTLKSHGKVVTDRKQAIAIALSSAGLSNKYEDGGMIENFRLPEADEYPVANCGIPDYNTALDRWALYYENIV